MKTAISIPDRTFKSAENLAKQLSMSRSELYVKALEHYLKLYSDEELTENFNRVYENTNSQINPDLRSVARKVLEKNKW